MSQGTFHAHESCARGIHRRQPHHARQGRLAIRTHRGARQNPQGKGVWPAIWMLGEDRAQVGWPRCGEIDIMEFVGKEPTGIHGTLHYFAEGKHQSDGGTLHTNQPFADFHVYAVEWTPERIDFFFDDQKYHTVHIDKANQGAGNPFRAPQYLILNFALGGSWGGPIDDAVLPQKFLIDYVRVYQSTDNK